MQLVMLLPLGNTLGKFRWGCGMLLEILTLSIYLKSLSKRIPPGGGYYKNLYKCYYERVIVNSNSRNKHLKFLSKCFVYVKKT